MNKAELIREISNKTSISFEETTLIIDSLFEVIKEEVHKQKKITFKGFGAFFQKKRATKKVQLIKEKKTITLAEHYIPAFSASKTLKVTE
ncbi:histone family protein DNA-binding protein [Emticicia oligotrophica DSM 17448]|jgi:nucleoid DNA-binding protein|uniref:Histone family protein DNA-binding protein n=1 Tax=Emticicia oligotrophica (strain DSM 17448 / CIP 109782 / MTCC 6937 / GPTSA100-15) TaxID=929562 RepID=A0ABN4AQD8_EMTOG|nr:MULTISPECIES: HU family DNA-binding protein [Emticicia]AFK04615.1 histone family protein DNA-binding protein [Emticicia oligotrophica DSM 17448]